MDFMEYSDETLTHIHEVEFMILKDFIEICEKYDLEYYSYGGTTLGAIRHQGFIPWDDDIDILMFREDYDKFLEIMKTEKTEKYEILNIDNYHDYFYTFSKMSLKGTRFGEYWDEKTSFKIGINIDIFVLDYAPTNKLKWIIYFNKCIFLRKLGSIFQIIINDYYKSTFKMHIGHAMKKIFKIFNINNNKIMKKIYKNLTKYDSNSENTFDISAICFSEPIPKKIFRPIKKAKFESIEINIPNDVHTYLTLMYGDTYMELPPENERYNHLHNNIDFGKY